MTRQIVGVVRRYPGTLGILVGWLLLALGCADLAYYRQAVSGQWELITRRRPVAEVLGDSQVPPALRQRLETARAMREFASVGLGLPDNGSYRTYADLQRPYVVWNVFAAEELSLQPREWCFPVVGCVGYRGYFREAAAQALAKSLRRDGYDVYVSGVPAYSTLGWFDDPLLNTFVSWPAGRLAELVFHELAHQRLFIDGDTAFNESFATTVGRMGALRWLESHGTEVDRQTYVVHGQRRAAFLVLVGQAKGELEKLYESDQSPELKRRGKQEILKDLQARYRVLKHDRWGGYTGYDRWFDDDLNNAKLAALSSYTRYVPAFEAIFHDVGEDFPAFYQAAEELGGLARPAREAFLQQLLDENPQVSDARPCASRCSGILPLRFPEDRGA